MNKRIHSLALAAALFICVVAAALGPRAQASSIKQAGTITQTDKPTSAVHAKRRRGRAHQHHKRTSALTLRASAKKGKRVPKAKSLSDESY